VIFASLVDLASVREAEGAEKALRVKRERDRGAEVRGVGRGEASFVASIVEKKTKAATKMRK